MHWDGARWSILPSADLDNLNWERTSLNGVAVTGPNDVWAVGERVITTTHSTGILIAHWDGTTWQRVPVPAHSGYFHYLKAVTAIAPDDVWAVGYVEERPTRTLIMHWDGTAWSVVPSPNTEAYTNELHGVAGTSSKDVLAVGLSGADPHNFQAVFPHWAGTQG